MKNTDPEARIMDGSLWADFCDSLKEAGNIVLQPNTPNDPFNRAEGYRYLTRLLRAGLESQIESSDPYFPRFFQLSNETIKIGNDNPDNIYHNANIDGSLEYRIRGQRGSVPYLSFGTKAGGYDTTGSMEPSGQIDSDSIIFEDDGSFEIIVSATRRDSNWLPMQPDTRNLIVRQTFHDRAQESPAVYSIECTSPRSNNYLRPAEFAEQLEGSVRFVSGTATLFVEWMERYRTHLNQLPSDDQERCQQAGGDANIHYLQSFWKLAPDEALVVRANTIPTCKTWNFQISNYWMESLDYRYHNVCINQHTAHYGNDGSVLVVIAHENPGPRYPNWLETAGHDQGGMLWRWVEAQSFPPLETEVVRFSDL